MNGDSIILSGAQSLTIDIAACDQCVAQSSRSHAEAPHCVQVCFVLQGFIMQGLHHAALLAWQTGLTHITQSVSSFMSNLLKMGVVFREAVRGEDLLLLTHSLSSEGDRAEGSGAGQHEAAVLAIVEKVESEKELDGSRKLVAYATVCLAGMVYRNPNQQPMSPKVANYRVAESMWSM